MPAKRRLAGGDGPAFDLADDDELGHDPDPEQPPDREPVGRHEVGPEEELAAPQAHAERDDGRTDDVPEPGHARHAADELEWAAVTGVGKGVGVRRVGQGGSRRAACTRRCGTAVPPRCSRRSSPARSGRMLARSRRRRIEASVGHRLTRGHILEIDEAVAPHRGAASWRTGCRRPVASRTTR